MTGLSFKHYIYSYFQLIVGVCLWQLQKSIDLPSSVIIMRYPVKLTVWHQKCTKISRIKLWAGHSFRILQSNSMRLVIMQKEGY